MRIPVYERRAGISPLNMPTEQPHPQLSDNGQNVSQTLSDTFARLQKFSDDLEDTQTLEAFNKFKLDSQDYHENPDTGILHTRLGGKSFGLYHDADDWLRHKGEDYARELPSERAKRNFRKMAREHITQRGVQNSRFEADQMKKYRQETADASIKNSLIFAERNWDKLEAIEQARTEIAQALELKMRGSSPDAFKHAWAEIEDQLGVARIRQAFTIDPLLAVEHLNNNQDIHLKPETAAKLRETLMKKTEIYEIQAIADSYSQLYTPEHQVEAQNILNQRYGADKGSKAFAALQRKWSIQENQITARKRGERDAQIRKENEYLKQLDKTENLDPSIIDDIKRDRDSGAIGAQFASSALNVIQSRIDAEKKAQDKAREDTKKAAKQEIRRQDWANAQKGIYLSDEELQQRVDLDVYTLEQADTYRAKQRQEENRTFELQRQAIVQKYNEGTLTPEEVDAASGKILKPDDAKAIKDFLRADAERKQRREEQDFKQAQAQRRDILIRFINNGFVPPRQVVNKWFKDKLIDDSTAKMVYAKIDQNEREEKQRQKENAITQAKADKAAWQDDLDKQSKELVKNSKTDSEVREAIASRDDLTPEQRDYFLKQANIYLSTRTKKQKEIKQARTELEEEQFRAERWHIYSEVNSLAEIREERARYEQLAKDGIISGTHRNSLIAFLNEKEQQFKSAAKTKEQIDNYDIARDYFSRFGLDNIHTARQEIRQQYTDPAKVNGIMTQLDKLTGEAREQQNDEAKALREQQEQTFTDLKNKYWRNGVSVPNEELSQLEQSGGLTPQQIDRAHSINAGLRFKKQVEEQLMQNPNIDFAGKSPAEREALVMERMGISKEQRADNVAYLLKKVMDGTSSDSEIEEFETRGYISASDKDYIKGFDSKFDRVQKERLRDVSRRMGGIIRDLYNNKSKEYSQILRNAQDKFQSATFNIDPRAKDFDKAVAEIAQRILGEVADEFANTKDLTDWFWPFTQPSAAALRLQTEQQKIENFSLSPMSTGIPFLDEALGLTMSISPTGQITSYDNSAPTLPPVVPPPVSQEITSQDTSSIRQAVQAEQNPDSSNGDFSYNGSISSLWRQAWPDNANSLRGMSDVTKSILDGTAFRISSPFSATATKLRDGRGHLAVDCAVPVGTPVHTPQYGGQWKVIKTGQNSTAGKFVKIQSTLDSGDVHEYTYAHLNSWDFKEGDIVSQGDIVAKSGNTGHSTGPHLHVALKVNGKPVDPTKVNINGGAAMRPGPTIQRAQFLPQPLEEPDIMSDEEMYQATLELLGLGNDISGDISTLVPYGGNF